MGKPSFYFDLDGTLSTEQELGAPGHPEMLAAARELIAAGYDVTVWSASEKYVRDWCAAHDLQPTRMLKKPSVIIDNKGDLGKHRLPPWTPAKFLSWFQTKYKGGK